MKKICKKGDVDIKIPVKRDSIRLVENVIDDATRFVRYIIPIIMACLLGYFYGKAHINPIVVTCTTQQEYILPMSLPKTGVKQVGPNEILITKDVCDPIEARRKLHKYLIQRKLGKR